MKNTYNYGHYTRLALVATTLAPLVAHLLPTTVALPSLIAAMLIYNRLDKGVTALFTISRYMRSSHKMTVDALVVMEQTQRLRK